MIALDYLPFPRLSKGRNYSSHCQHPAPSPSPDRGGGKGGTFSHIIGAYFNRFMITDKKFTVDSDVCIHCGRCAEECPVGDIVFDKTPQWKHDGSCTCCLSCYHHCPVHAINYGRITRKRGQYYFGHV